MKKTLYILFLVSFSLYSQTQVGEAINIGAEHIETSYDGNKIAIIEDINGAVNVKTYVYDNSVWITNSGNDISNSDMGIDYSSLSMSKNGNFLAVGSSNRNFSDGIGIVRVYENINNQWVQVGDDLTTGNEIDGFGNGGRGNGIDLSADGSVIAIGASTYYGAGTFRDNFGLVRVFHKTNGNWVQMGSDIIGEIYSYTGSAVSLSDDGLTMAVGAAHSQNYFGNVKIYSYQNNDWVQIGNAINGQSENDLLTFTMSISASGNRLAISTPNPGNFTMGYAKVYENINNSWVQIGETIGGDGTYYRLGIRISLSSDGSILALSSNFNTTIYQVTENTINQFDAEIESTGGAMNLSSDGTKVIVKNSSEVFVYDISGIFLSSEEYNDPILSFYPNPTKNNLNIALDKNDSLKQINIYTINGKAMLSSRSTSINTSILPSGMYIVEIESLLGKSLKKLIIQ